MKIKMAVGLIILSLLLASFTVTAQQDPPPLTNDDVKKMLKVELPESTIITVIQVSPTAFDTSSKALEKLRNKGASDRIIAAMLGTQKSETADGVRASRLPLAAAPPRSRPFNVRSLVRNALNFEKQVCKPRMSTVNDCHENYETGCVKKGPPTYDPYLNVLKNQMPPPDLEPTRTLNKAFFETKERETAKLQGLGEKNHASFAQELANLGEGEIVALVGYLIHVKKMDKESCNCQMNDEEEDVDFHMWVGFDEKPANDYIARRITKKELEKQKPFGVVVEMSPFYRHTHFKDSWTYDKANKAVGRQVKVVGMLLMDNEHNNRTENCGYTIATPKSDCWRMSAWELHPVTQFYVCEGSQRCTVNSPNWTPL